MAVGVDGTILGDATSGATIKEEGVVCLDAVCPAATLGPHRIDGYHGA